MKQHRGRFQAQGGGVEESEKWAQDEPLKKEEGLKLLEALKDKLSEKEYKAREKQFKDAERLIRNADGIDAHFAKSFRNLKATDPSTRVDIEVLGGKAFICLLIVVLLFLLLKPL